jgi:hypothetical protein
MSIQNNIRSLRLNGLSQTIFDDDREADDNFFILVEELRKNSKVLNTASFIQGKPNAYYTFNINDTAEVITHLDSAETILASNAPAKLLPITPKGLAIQLRVDLLADIINKDNIEKILKGILYRPFAKAIEKAVINGTFFDSPLWNTDRTIEGQLNFDGLLTLARTISAETDQGYIVGNTSIINTIIDSMTDTAYKNELLLNGTLEGVKIIKTVNAPNDNEKKLIAYDASHIKFLMDSDILASKFKVLGEINVYYQFMIFINGGIISERCIGLVEEEPEE